MVRIKGKSFDFENLINIVWSYNQIFFTGIFFQASSGTNEWSCDNQRHYVCL